MKLSIIVPVYNMAADNKLKYCLDSLIEQSIADYEIIAVDDASTDASLEILRTYESNYPWKFKVIQSCENLKQGGARNKGIEAARGKWIGFVDSDDWVAPDMYKKLMKKAEKTGADVVGCDYCMVNSHTMEVGRLMPNNTMDQTGVLDQERYKKLVINPGSMVIKIYLKSVIDTYQLRFPENTFYEDNCAAPIWMLHFTHFEKVEEPLYYYYQHDLSTVHEISQEKCEMRLLMGKKLIEEARRYNIYQPYRQEFEFAFSKLYYMNTLFTYMFGVKKPKVRFLKQIAEGIRQEFPDFQENAYYQNAFDKEQKRLAAMHMESPLKFKLYFQLLWFYRRKIRHIQG